MSKEQVANLAEYALGLWVLSRYGIPYRIKDATDIDLAVKCGLLPTETELQERLASEAREDTFARESFFAREDSTA